MNTADSPRYSLARHVYWASSGI